MEAEAQTAAAPRPGRPPSDAPERILDAAFDVLKRDGYAGLTTAKVAAGSGQNKALIAYYFGSKQGLVEAVARRVSDTIVDEVLGGVGKPRTALELVRGLTAGVWRVMDRDEGIQRVYFDLASQSVVAPGVSQIMREIKQGYRSILRELLRGLDDPPDDGELDSIAVFLIAGIEGLALERLDRGDTRALGRARELFVRSASAAIG
ncbi:MAG: TetR/AcrR family transcriptional regulator [Solirubrobacterales bacterium]